MLSLLYAHQAHCSRMFLREPADGKVSVDCSPSEEAKLAAEARRQDLAFRRDDAEEPFCPDRPQPNAWGAVRRKEPPMDGETVSRELGITPAATTLQLGAIRGEIRALGFTKQAGGQCDKSYKRLHCSRAV